MSIHFEYKERINEITGSRPVNKRTNLKKKNKLISSIIVCVIAIAGLLGYRGNSEPSAQSPSAHNADSVMEVHFIDVGQADSILVESAGKYMMIDAGNNEDGDLIENYLKNEGIKELEYVIATHPHEDHVGGMDDIIKNFQVDNVIMPNVTHTTKTFEDVLNAISDKNLSITIPQVGEQYSLGNANFTIIAPNKEDYGDERNNYSVGIKLVNGNNSFIMCGDAEEEAERDILDNGIDISADVYKVSHHGSRTGTTKEFLEAISPRYAVIECGSDNDYGHPHEEILELLESKKIKVFRTDINGTIIAVSDGNKITWTSEK
jgi:competence protein ComEC